MQMVVVCPMDPGSAWTGLPPNGQQSGVLRAVIDALQCEIAVLAASGDVLLVNEAWRRHSADEGEAVERMLLGRVHPDDGQRWLATWRGALAAGQPYEIEHRMLSGEDGGTRWYLQRGIPLREPSGNIEHWLVTASPIDEHKHKEEELRALLHRKDEFFATLLHELRNPLAPIASALELLGRQSDDVRTVTAARGIIQRQLRQITRLVDDLLDVSRIGLGHVELRRSALDVAEIVAVAIETARPLIELRNHNLSTFAPPGPLLVDADPIRMAQVLTNLLINAAKYTNPGGHITVITEPVQDMQGEKPGRVLLRVRDDGIGIAREQLSGIFELFAQASHSAARMGGLGVGLAVARQLVELHGGSISVQSEGPGRGSEFTISLPMMRDTPASAM